MLHIALVASQSSSKSGLQEWKKKKRMQVICWLHKDFKARTEEERGVTDPQMQIKKVSIYTSSNAERQIGNANRPDKEIKGKGATQIYQN